jgi:two-component system chemotaxis response regulator CheY
MAKILFADDSLSIRLVALRFLTTAGYQVTLAADGDEAIERFGVDRPDAVIADISMPAKSGFAVCAHVRGQPYAADMPVLLTSPIVDEDVKRQADLCRATTLIKKPFSWEGLVAQIEALLAPKQPARSGSETGGESPPSVYANGSPEAKREEMETRLAAEQERCRHLEDRAMDLRSNLMQATETISNLQARLARSEEQCGQLTQKIREIEYAAAWSERLTKFLADLSESKSSDRDPEVSAKTEDS